MRKSLIVILFVYLAAPVTGLKGQVNEYGVPLITNYPYNLTGGSEQNWSITQDHRGVVYVGNQNKGILEYDGVEWRTIPVPNESPVTALITGNNGSVYAGMAKDFGRLTPDENGKLEYVSLCDSSLLTRFDYFEIWRAYAIDEFIYFCAGPATFLHNTDTDETTLIENPENGFFSYLLGTTLYHGNYGLGLMKYVDAEFRMVNGGDKFRELSIMGMSRIDENLLLIGTYLEGLLLLNEQTGTVNENFVSAKLNEEFRSVNITYAEKVGDQILVCTGHNGLYILDLEGNLRSHISEKEGLIDHKISRIYSDQRLSGSGPIWIAHWKGISKIETNNPFTLFTEKSGFDGLIHSATLFNDRLFLATASGLYFNEGTGFRQVEEIPEQIWDLHVVENRRGQERLIALGTFQDGYQLDDQLNVTKLRDLVVNPPKNREDVEQFTGRHMITDYFNPRKVYTGYNQLVGLEQERDKWREFLSIDSPGVAIYSLAMDKHKYIWITTLEYLFKVDVSVPESPVAKIVTSKNGLPADESNKAFINPMTQEVLIGTKNNFYRYDYYQDTILYDSTFSSLLPQGENTVWMFYEDEDGDYWISLENSQTGWVELILENEDGTLSVRRSGSFQRLPNTAVDVFQDDGKNGVWFSKSDELYHYDKGFVRNDSLPFITLIRKVGINSGDSVIFQGSNFRMNGFGGRSVHISQEEGTEPIIKYAYNNILFHWAAPYFEQEEKLEYSYRLTGFSDEWSEWHESSFKEFTNLKHRKYTLWVKAKNIYGRESEPAVYSFTISRPWYASIPALIAYIVLSGLLIYVIIKLYTRRLKNENIRLEGIIEERTAEIRKQKEELTDSIEYASRIQRALLPSDTLLDELSIEHFILFRPRDIVSGDFYWMGHKNGKMLIVAADCTGHGVPGAFMSMLGMTFLDEIVIKSEITSTEEIMEALKEYVINSLEQSGSSADDEVKDGMDLAMIAVDMENQTIQYSGAYNPLYLVRKLKRGEKTKLKNGEVLDLPRGSIHDDEHLLIQLRADQMPIGVSEKDMPFTSTTLKDEGFNIYMFSDGFLDQFGGPQGKKFMSKNFKKLLLELQSVPVKEQGQALEKVLLGWMGEISQIDDILVMGLRLSPS